MRLIVEAREDEDNGPTLRQRVRTVVVTCVVVLAALAGVIVAFNLAFPGVTVEECIANNVAMYVESQENGLGTRDKGPDGTYVERQYTVTEAGKADAAADAAESCKRYAD